jgi:hypothetical protein
MTIPPPGAEAPRAKRTWGERIRWLLAALICVAPPVAYFWWRFAPRTAAAPLAMIPLPDGTELRLVATSVGPKFHVRSTDDFEDRVISTAPTRYRSSSTVGSGGDNASWLVFSVYSPTTNTFTHPSFRYFEILDNPGTMPFAGNCTMASGQSDHMPPINPVAFEVIPRRSAKLKVRFEYRNRMIESEIPNPFLDLTTPAFHAEPVPHTKIVDGATFEFLGVSSHPFSRSVNGRTTKGQTVSAKLTAKVSAMPGQGLEISSQFFDPTGNEITHGMLPMGDRVWGLRVTAQEPSDFPFPPEQRIVLGKFSVPGAGQILKLDVPPKLAVKGVGEIFVLGTGRFNWADGTITGPGNATAMQTARSKYSVRGQCQTTGVGIVMFAEQPSSLDKLGGFLRMRAAGERIAFRSSSSSGSGSISTLSLSDYHSPKTGAPKPGEDLEIEFVFPKSRTAEFYFERPKLPGE